MRRMVETAAAGSGRMQVDLEGGRHAFLDGLSAFVEVVQGLGERDVLSSSRCHGWSVADVLVHVHLGLQEMFLGFVSPVDRIPDTDAATYWLSELPTNDSDADDIAQIRFVRLVAAAYRRPNGLVSHLLNTVKGVAKAARSAKPGPIEFQDRVLLMGDFLATWAVELAVHHLDLGRELQLAPPAPAAARLARATVESLAGSLPSRWTDERVVLLGTGRVQATDDEVREAQDVIERLPAFG